MTSSLFQVATSFYPCGYLRCSGIPSTYLGGNGELKHQPDGWVIDICQLRPGQQCGPAAFQQPQRGIDDYGLRQPGLT